MSESQYRGPDYQPWNDSDSYPRHYDRPLENPVEGINPGDFQTQRDYQESLAAYHMLQDNERRYFENPPSFEMPTSASPAGSRVAQDEAAVHDKDVYTYEKIYGRPYFVDEDGGLDISDPTTRIEENSRIVFRILYKLNENGRIDMSPFVGREESK
jgi:hypothetical protein